MMDMASRYLIQADETPEQADQRKRMMIAQALAPSSMPQDVGQGMSAIGNAMAYRQMMDKQPQMPGADGKPMDLGSVANSGRTFGGIMSRMFGGR